MNELKNLLILRQNVLSQLTKKWTMKEMEEYDNVLSESEIKLEIFDNNLSIFDETEINMLKRCLK